MGLIVQKFGGSSVKDRDRIFNVARIVMNTRNAGNDVVVVVSAQGDTTDDLIAKAAEITSDPSHREMDMLLAAGEEISISLLTMALQELGVSAISLTGWQAGFNTDRAYSKARIKRLDTERVESELARNRVVVVAGFQGLNRSDDITTLGRGGSDTSAVALAAALHADRCQIFTDVEGVYTADPRKIPKATKLKEITFDEMLELASLGAQVLNNRSVELAKKYNVELEVISSINPVPGTVVKEETKVEGMLIKGVAKDTDVAVLTVKDVPDVPGMSFKIFSLLAQKNINVDIILQTTGRDGKKDMSFTVPLGDAESAVAALKNATHRIVVMKDGIIQQVDTPQNLYDMPCNMFVAGFIGSPQMNFLDGTLIKKGELYGVDLGGDVIPLPKEKTADGKLDAYVGKKIKMGVRPEDIDDEPEFMAKHADCQLDAQVDVSEMMGAEIYLYLEYKGNKMTARVAPTSKARNGDTVRVAFDPHKVHLFDIETELTILN